LNPDYAVQDYNPINTYYDSNLILKKAGFTPEAIIVLFMPKFLSFKNLYELNKSTKAPVFIYPMDMAPMTGGCHYAWDCEGYHNKCGFCPAYCSNAENDQSRKNWYFKKKFIEKTDIASFYGNEQLHSQLQKSSLLKSTPKFKIPISINDSVFRPGEMKKARNFFGLPLKKKIVFFGATNVNQKRKGFSQLLETLKIANHLAKDKLEIHMSIAGKLDNSSELKNIFNYTLLGSLNHEQLALAFQAADLFLCPSIEDSGPMWDPCCSF
jgi:glycosyltransferase involved in cell wall biosynthesis